MRKLIVSLVLLALPAHLALGAAAAKKKTTHKKAPAHKSRKKKVTWRNRQVEPTRQRYQEIQDALIRKGYLKGEATGVWDQESVGALRRFQQEQNLEPSGKIDALSLIALGLGPKHESASLEKAHE